MKKLRILSVMFVMTLAICSLTGCNDDENGTGSLTGYVDLGLPSGTKWKSANETGGHLGLYTFDEAVNTFGDKLPSKEQLNELRAYCLWEWDGSGYKVTGTNDKSIRLPAAGVYSPEDDETYYIGTCGNYWSFTTGDWGGWYLCFYSDNDVYVTDGDFNEGALSVRLVKKP